jgi:hypothetical protein
MDESHGGCRRGGDQPEGKKHVLQQRRALALVERIVK